jgi:hypothetical protein
MQMTFTGSGAVVGFCSLHYFTHERILLFHFSVKCRGLCYCMVFSDLYLALLYFLWQHPSLWLLGCRMWSGTIEAPACCWRVHGILDVIGHYIYC